MSLGDALKRIFSGWTVGTPADERQLAGGNEAALASSLQKLPNGERGWITMAQAAALFSHEEEQYAFGEMDDAGRNRLATFTAANRCTPDFRPTENRIYFKKAPARSQYTLSLIVAALEVSGASLVRRPVCDRPQPAFQGLPSIPRPFLGPPSARK
jgi:hypothetical protein